MIITIASGKGGTGKTTVAANLARVIAEIDSKMAWLVDCDAEEPNAAIFLSPTLTDEKNVERLLPVIDAEKCTACGVCTEICVYNALAVAGGKTLFFKELCHACGSCARHCPEDAISEAPEEIGLLQKGTSGALHFAQGTLAIGFSSPVPVIRELKKWVIGKDHSDIYLLDSSPGTSCPVVETLRGSDFSLFVTEPTPFGLHDLKLVVELNAREFNLPSGIVINKSGKGDALIEEFAGDSNIPVLMRIPLSREIAELYSVGGLLVEAQPQYKVRFMQLFDAVTTLCAESEAGK